MTELLANPYIGTGLPDANALEPGQIRTDPGPAIALYGHCPIAQETPLLQPAKLAADFDVGSIALKDERGRMELGSFKALGAAHAIAKLAAKAKGDHISRDFQDALAGQTFVCASAGNHGLSMAAGAQVFGANAVVYIADSVPQAFAEQLATKGAKVVRHGANYEASMQAAKRAAIEYDWQLLSDSTWPGYHEPAQDVMEGYLIMGAEIARQIDEPPTHVFLQAGVGGLAAACAATVRDTWGNNPKICVVEPDFAPALMDSIAAGKALVTAGPISNMGRLDCKEPSHLALKYLAEQADYFMTITDAEASAAVATLGAQNIETTPSGVAGFAGFINADRAKLGIGAQSRILVVISEAPTDED